MKDWLPLAIFLSCYALFAILPSRRPWVSAAGAMTLILLRSVPWKTALFDAINWNVMGLFWGTLVLADLFMLSRVPAVLAERLVDRTQTARSAMLVLCALSGLLSVVLENVAVVLLVSPVAISLARKLELRPVRLLIGIAVCSNLQGTATMIGDPPSMIVAGHLHMGFLDFFIYRGRLSIFFAVQAGAVASLLVLAWIFRGHRQRTAIVPVETVRSWFPSVLLLLLILGLSLTTLVDPSFFWFAGCYTLLVTAGALIWLWRVSRWTSLSGLLRELDWSTTVFLLGIFVIVEALSQSPWLGRLTTLLEVSAGARLGVLYVLLVGIATLCSAFVDNVPFILAMLPITHPLAEHLQAPVPLLVFGLLIGTCLGGNLTPFGASANVVAMGLLKKHGYPTQFREFWAVGVPFTAAALGASALLVWIVWAHA